MRLPLIFAALAGAAIIACCVAPEGRTDPAAPPHGPRWKDTGTPSPVMENAAPWKRSAPA